MAKSKAKLKEVKVEPAQVPAAIPFVETPYAKEMAAAFLVELESVMSNIHQAEPNQTNGRYRSFKTAFSEKPSDAITLTLFVHASR